MLDILFALAVLAAVIIFGALISMGNERQRRAIDGLREQAAGQLDRVDAAIERGIACEQRTEVRVEH